MYADWKDVENFNHKHGGTIMFSEAQKEWLYVCGMVSGKNISIHKVADETLKLKKENVDLSINDLKLLKKGPDVQFYNDFRRGEGLFYRRRPRRTFRHTLTIECAELSYPFFGTLPGALQRELDMTLPSAHGNAYGFIWILNNNSYPSFEGALEQVESSKMASCAFNKNFMVSMSPKEAGKNVIWYQNLPIGTVQRSEQRINIDKLLLLQEVRDTLKEQGCKWLVVA